MLRVRISQRPLRALVFDIENRPLSYWYDRPTAEVTVISYKWLGNGEPTVLMQTRANPVASILRTFRKVYDRAEVVIGHNVRRHDLPIVHGALIEQGLPGLAAKLTIDTYRDLTGYKDIPKSLEYLADLLGSPFPKYHMTQHSWRVANRLEKGGVALARERCATDVQITEWVYNTLLERGLLTKPAKVWKP